MEKLHTTAFAVTLRKLMVISLFVMYMSFSCTEAAKIGSRSIGSVEGLPNRSYQNLNSDEESKPDAKKEASSAVEQGNENQPNPEGNSENPSEAKLYTVTVYPWNNHLGRPALMEWTTEERKSNSCKEIPSRWQGKVRSIDTHDNCVVLFNRSNCNGIFRTVKKGSPSHNRLSDICFQRKPMSARPCTLEEENPSSSNSI